MIAIVASLVSLILGIVVGAKMTSWVLIKRLFAGDLYWDEEHKVISIDLYDSAEECMKNKFITFRIIPHNTHVL